MPQKILPFLKVVAVVIILMGAGFWAGQAQAPQPYPPASSQAFSYQGQLKKNGNPYSGSCSFTFRLWDAPDAGAQIGGSQTLASVPVDRGVFNVVLNGAGQFGASAFNGSPRWLEVLAQCTGDVEPVPLGRQAINSAPFATYALSAGNCDTLDSQHSSNFLTTTGGSLTGNLIAPKMLYTTPRLHSTSVSSEAFVPISNIDYWNGGGQGGAQLTAGATGIMAAAVQLPDGATVTKFRAYFYDNSVKNLQIDLSLQYLQAGGYGSLASINTGDIPASTSYQFLEDTTITSMYAVVNNVSHGYLVWVYPQTSWDGSELRVKGATIWYTLPEAP